MCYRSKANLHTEAGGSEHLREHILTARHFTDTSECSFIFFTQRFASLSKGKKSRLAPGREVRWVNPSRLNGHLLQVCVGTDQTASWAKSLSDKQVLCTLLELCLHCRCLLPPPMSQILCSRVTHLSLGYF